MKKYMLITLVIALLFFGCATARKINQINVGMTKEEVIAVMGPPVSTSAKEGVEYLNYKLSETDDDAFMGWTTPYYVRIRDGKVDAFGRHGDFDSTKTPTIRIEKDETIKQDMNLKVDEKPDLYIELMKLKELKEQGILTEEEFKSKKKEILERY
jgi:hypothetical protein